MLSAAGRPGERPTVTFRLKDKAGNPILASDMTRLALVLAGPAADYASPVSANALTAPGSASGEHTFTFPNPLPAEAKGTYSVGIEGYRNITLLPGTTRETVARDRGANRVIHFSVDGSAVTPRRQVVDTAKCNSCHTFLSLHGDNRNQVEMCVLCHNPTATDASRRPAGEGPPQSVNFALLIHKIHTGEELEQDYTVFGFGASRNNYNRILFPGDRRDCSSCHVNGSEELPLAATAMVTDPRGPIDPVGPITSACTGCHSSLPAASHALTNTSRLGEACATCHGPDAEFSVSKVHAR
jgi:OmcA/MtrC family decaheme c-type cytochrome